VVAPPHAPSTPAPAAFPLRLRLAPAWVRPRFALLGDAAHAVHPLAGQGVNLGFADAAALGDALAATVAAGGDVGALAPTLSAFYQRARRPATGAWVAALDGLATLFGPEGKGLKGDVVAAVRGAGLRAVGAAGPARAAIVRFASGV
jgi:2-polyprenyl-6-methoxyphenol hydroxylase-like FAD-dependent oxidoreductase